MPIYEYVCQACGLEFEALQKVNDPPPKSCECGTKGKVQRKMSLAAFHLQGGGWYKDQYGGGASPGNTPTNGANGSNGASANGGSSEKGGSEAKNGNGSTAATKSEGSASGGESKTASKPATPSGGGTGASA